MDYLFLFAVIVVVQCSYGYHPDERQKLTSEPGRHYPTKKSDDHYEDPSDGPSDYGDSTKYHSDSKEEESEPNYELYKPVNTYGPFGPNEEDAKYIPHSETYSKYVNPKETFSSHSKHDWKDEDDNYHNEDTKKSEEVPRYGFVRENHHDSNHKHYENEESGESHVKHPLPYRYGSDENSDGYKHNDHDNDHHKSYHHVYHHYPEHESHHDNHDYPKHGSHEENHHYPKHGSHEESHHYPKHGSHEESHHYPKHGSHEESHHYPKHGSHEESHHYPKHESHEENHHYPEHESHHDSHHYPKHGSHHESHHYPEHGSHHDSHHYPDNENYHHSKDKEEHGHHYSEHKKHHDHGPEEDHGKHHLRYQHWSDKGAESFPLHNSDKLIGEIYKSKPHHSSSGSEKIPKHKTWHKDEPHVEEFIEEHKPPHKLNDHKSHHKKHSGGSKKRHYFLTHYPHINKFHREHHHKSFLGYKPEFNIGGHNYGWMYKPKMDLFQQMKKDLHIKMRLLKEHEEKLAELQRNHLEKYRAMFQPHHTKKFLKHELSKHIIPNIEYKLHSHLGNDGKHDNIESSHAHHSKYSKEPEYTNHKPKHYEIPHSKHDSLDKEPKHYSEDPHHYKDDYVP